MLWNVLHLKFLSCQILNAGNFLCGTLIEWWRCTGTSSLRAQTPFQTPVHNIFSPPWAKSTELNLQRTVWNLSHGKRWSHLGIDRHSIWTRSSLERGLWRYCLSLQPQQRVDPVPHAYMEIVVQPQHPRSLCRCGTPSPLTTLKTTKLLTHVYLLGGVELSAHMYIWK